MVGIVSPRHHVHMQPLSAQERLIVALDVPTVQEAKEIVKELRDIVTFYKIGLHLQLDLELPSLFKSLKEDKKQIFLDFKYIDIPATIEGVVRAASRLEIKFITVMGQGHIVEAAVKGKGNSDLKILAVTLLTGMTQTDMQKEYNTKVSLEEFIKTRAIEASSMGCDGVISSPNEVKLIRSVIHRDNFLVVTPGIRPTGAQPDDQKRTATPYDAILNGADYLVVGRPIIQQENKRLAARNIIKDMEAALDDRGNSTRSASLPASAAVY